jgi:hypothetical protein
MSFPGYAVIVDVPCATPQKRTRVRARIGVEVNEDARSVPTPHQRLSEKRTENMDVSLVGTPGRGPKDHQRHRDVCAIKIVLY